MTRRYDECIEVRLRDGDPEQFLWRDRLYLVQEVLATWTATGEWWRGPAVRALLSGGSRHQHGAPAAVGVRERAIDLQERDFWRVVAGRGRTYGTGVYDLACDWSTGRWSLVRGLD